MGFERIRQGSANADGRVWEGSKVKRFLASIAIVTAMVSFGATTPAQTAGGGPATTSSQGIPNLNGENTGSMRDQFNKLQTYDYNARKVSVEDKKNGKTLAQLLAEDKTAALELIRTMPLNCEVTDAMKVAEGTITSAEGKTGKTTTYEVSCTNGLGYFLVAQDVGKLDGFSCFAADATRAADTAAGKKPGITCQLPANSDPKAIGTRVLSKAGLSCEVRKYRLIGDSTVDHTEFLEFACTNNDQGYVVTSALPGSTVPVHVETCPQSAARGLPCEFSDNGGQVLTLKSFRDALAQHGIACDATDKTTRLIGQQTRSKRHVVEFHCPQQPKGLVALIPLGDNPAPFETMDCPTAKQKQGVVCSLSQ